MSKFYKSLCFAALIALSASTSLAQYSSPYDDLTQIHDGLAVGKYETLSDAQKAHFSSLLAEAKEVLLFNGAPSNYLCISQGGDFYILADANSGKKFGSPVYGLESCKKTLPAAGSDFTCLSSGGDFYQVTNLRSGKVLGTQVYGLDSCKTVLPSPGQKLACVPQGGDFWVIMNLETGATLGNTIYGQSACKAQLP